MRAEREAVFVAVADVDEVADDDPVSDANAEGDGECVLVPDRD